GHCDHCCLRRGISKHSGVAFFAGDRGNVKQSAVSSLYHLWQDRLGSVVRAKEVNPEYAFHVLGVCFMAAEVSFSSYTGTIHQYIDRRKSLERLLDLLPNGHIANYGHKVLS